MTKKIILLFALFCFAFSANSSYFCKDSERLAKICPMFYTATCGIGFVNGTLSKTSFSNRCEACANSNVSFLIPQECSSIPTEASICQPTSKSNQICYELYKPVCGITYTLTQQEAANACFACANQDIMFHLPGKCAPSQ